MKRALVTMVDDDFYPGFRAFIISFLKHNLFFEDDLVIIDAGLSQETKEKIQRYYSRIVFKSPNKDMYKNVSLPLVKKQLQKTIYKLEIFSYSEYDRIVFIDSDCLVLGDISRLFNEESPIAAVPAFLRSKGILNEINSGVIVINKPIINSGMHLELIKNMVHEGIVLPDQQAINKHFDGRITRLPKEFNVEKRYSDIKLGSYDATFDNGKPIKILHYVGEKPWYKTRTEVAYQSLYDFWERFHTISVRRSPMSIPGLIRLCEDAKKHFGRKFSLVEIGSYAGDSAEIFVRYTNSLTCIDPWENLYDPKDQSSFLFPMPVVKALFEERILDTHKQNPESEIVWLSMTSKKAATCITNLTGLDMVYIDGNHTYESVKEDLELWYPHVRKGGIIAGHDFQTRFMGTIKAVTEFFKKDPDTIYQDTSWMYKKV